MTIRESQMGVFQRELNTSFAWALLPRIKRQYAEKLSAETNAQLIEKILSALAQAQRYGFTLDRHLVAFIEICFMLDPDFHHRAPFSRILRHDDSSDDEKITYIFDEVLEILDPIATDISDIPFHKSR